MTTFLVDSYGAVGNGTTDDTAAIQSAINAAKTAGGGTIKLTAGKTYKISQSGSYTYIFGVLKCGLVFDGDNLIFEGPGIIFWSEPTPTTDVMLCFMTIGAGAWPCYWNGPEHGGCGVRNVTFTWTPGISFYSECKVILMELQHDWFVTGCNFPTTSTLGQPRKIFTGSSYRGTIANNTFTTTSFAYDIWIDGGWWLTVSGNVSTGGGITGLACNADNYRECMYNTLDGNSITHGYMGVCGQYNIIKNCTITNLSWPGPYMLLNYKDNALGKYTSSNNTFFGNTIKGGWESAISIDGKTVTIYDGTPLVSQGNVFYFNTFDTADAIVTLGQQAKNNSFYGNKLVSVTTNYNDQSGGTQTGNVFSNGIGNGESVSISARTKIFASARGTIKV